jgi:Zn-dependent protease
VQQHLARSRATLVGSAATELVGVVASVVAHEAGHFAAARAFGLTPRVQTEGSRVSVGHSSGTRAQNRAVAASGPLLHCATVVALSGRRHGLVTALLVTSVVASRQLAPVPGADGLKVLGTAGRSSRMAAYQAFTGLALMHRLASGQGSYLALVPHMDAHLVTAHRALADMYDRYLTRKWDRYDVIL